ncbi:MAG TPA: undecaprenyl diphosphate synthase family protein [Ilumatobacteraceae bacterium]
MVGKRGARGEVEVEVARALRHVLIVGGTAAEWNAFGDHAWAGRRADLAKASAHAGAHWLTMFPYSQSAPAQTPAVARLVEVHEDCTVIVDPSADGKARLLAAIASELMAPAQCEPDLTIILGPSTRLPPSLVWELAYSEIVFLEVCWSELTAVHVEHAIDEFSRRHRRFGGLG